MTGAGEGGTNLSPRQKRLWIWLGVVAVAGVLNDVFLAANIELRVGPAALTPYLIVIAWLTLLGLLLLALVARSKGTS